MSSIPGGARPYDDGLIHAMLASRAWRTLGRQQERNRAQFALRIATGCRVSECCALRIGDVVNERLELRTHLVIPSRKRQKGRIVAPWAKYYYDYLAPYIARIIPRCADPRAFLSDPLFVGYGGKPISEDMISRIDHAAHRELGLTGYATHSTRKTWAVHIYRSTVSRNRVSGISMDPFATLRNIGGWQSYTSVVAYISRWVGDYEGIERGDYD